MIEFPKMWGQCFDAAGIAMVNAPDEARLIHGVGIANAPGQEGKRIKHAWIELEGEAYDCVWEVRVPIQKYRHDLKLIYVVEYSKAEMWHLWRKTNMPGPWDPKIEELVKEQGD